jgi:hypothetical protein
VPCVNSEGRAIIPQATPVRVGIIRHNSNQKAMRTIKYLSIVAFMSVLLCGCQTTWQDATGKSLASIAQSVDSAMKGWAAYAAAKDIRPDNIVHTRVQAAYAEYQLAFSSALSAYNAAVLSNNQSGWLKASEALTAAQQSLVQLITQLEAK